MSTDANRARTAQELAPPDGDVLGQTRLRRLVSISDPAERQAVRNLGLNPDAVMVWKCDGNHGGPRCADPECWNDDPPGPEPAAPSEPLLDRVESLISAYRQRSNGPSHWTSSASADWKDRAAIVLRDAAAVLRESEARTLKAEAQTANWKKLGDGVRKEHARIQAITDKQGFTGPFEAEDVIAALRARCQAVTAERDKLQARLDGWHYTDIRQLREAEATLRAERAEYHRLWTQVGYVCHDQADKLAAAHAYLSRLLTHYAPQCEPLASLDGVCSQIDNLLVGLSEQAERDEHSRQINLHDAAGERESIAALLADRSEATTYLKVEALEKAESTLRATLGSLVAKAEAFLTAAEDYRCASAEVGPGVEREIAMMHARNALREAVLGAAPREGR